MRFDTHDMSISDLLKTIPSTRYQGSKRKILPWIYECLDGYEFHSVLDAFGGSCVVSCLFKRMGKEVTYNDLYRFNQIIGESIVENNDVLLTANDVDFLLRLNNNTSSYIANNFKGIYYLDEENRWLDSTITNIESLKSLYKGKVLKYKKAIAYNALFQACLAKRPYNLFHRKNLEMRVRDVDRSFGNKVTWDKSFPDHFTSFIKEINSSVYQSKEKCRAICKDVFSIQTNHYDLVYLDPPYIKKKGESNESSNYLKCYHFLEGIAKYNQWDDIVNKDTINKRIRDSYAPNYFTPIDARGVFEKLIKKFSNSIIALSYRYGGIPSIEDLSSIMIKYKKNVDIYDRKYKYALNKQNGDAKFNREYLLIGY